MQFEQDDTRAKKRNERVTERGREIEGGESDQGWCCPTLFLFSNEINKDRWKYKSIGHKRLELVRLFCALICRSCAYRVITDHHSPAAPLLFSLTDVSQGKRERGKKGEATAAPLFALNKNTLWLQRDKVVPNYSDYWIIFIIYTKTYVLKRIYGLELIIRIGIMDYFILLWII